MKHAHRSCAIVARPPRARTALAWSSMALLLGLGLATGGPALPAAGLPDAEATDLQAAGWIEDAVDDLTDIIDDLLGDPDEEDPPAEDPPQDPDPDEPNW